MLAPRYPIDPSLQAPLTVEKYHRMIEAGILDEGDRIELLEGVLVELGPRGHRHAKSISRLTAMLVPLVGPGHRVRVQLPLTLPPYGEPEPDIAVVTVGEDEAPDRHPQTALLVIEVASESIRKDRAVKSRVYARAGVPEYWIANLDAQCVEVHLDPDRTAERYRALSVARSGEELSPRAFPAARIPVDALLGG